MTYSKKFENRINKLGLYGKNVRVSYSGRKYVVDDPETFEIFEIFKNFDEIDNYLVTKEFEQIEKETLMKMALENIKKETAELEWVIDSDDLPERIRDEATHKAIDEYAEKNDVDSQELRWDYFDDIDEKVGDFLKEKYNSVSDEKNFYFYDKKYNFETVENLENYFGI